MTYLDDLTAAHARIAELEVELGLGNKKPRKFKSFLKSVEFVIFSTITFIVSLIYPYGTKY